MPLIIIIIISYLIGSIPFGFLIAKYRYGIDIRTVGSKNIGTTNVFRNLGAAAGAIVLAGDVGKGALAVFLAKIMIGGDLAMVLASCAVIIGHTWPITLSLRGGKGIATACGALIILTPGIAATLFVIWAIIVFFTKYVSLGSIAAAAAFPFLVFFVAKDREQLLLFSIAASAIVIWRHKSNISRLLAGAETKTTLTRKNSL